MTENGQREQEPEAPALWVQRLFSRILKLLGPLFWRASVDWQTRRPALSRATAHLSLALLALAVVAIASLEPPAQALGGPALVTLPPPTLTATAEETARSSWKPSAPLAISRLALPHTTIPQRPRSSVITYTVRPGDTVFGIAEMFGLTPHTIYWANTEALQDNPHLLWPDMVLNILPVNGVYHTVEEGETLASIAEEYGVDISRLYNEWNAIGPGQPLEAGMQLVIPGGTREFIVWQLPTYSDLRGSAAYDAGVCALPDTGLRGYGWFIWPTDSRRISGWVFRDVRNPPHSGIDIGLNTGDPIYAADNGVVRYAGWSNAGYGYLLVLDHGNGFQTYYAHLSAIWVVCGQSVYQGTAIGAGGNTGRSSGPHLHFEIRYEGYPQDPFAYLP